MDASYGCLIVGTKSGDYHVEDFTKNGFFAAGETRDLAELKYGDNESIIIVSVNDGPTSAYVINKGK